MISIAIAASLAFMALCLFCIVSCLQRLVTHHERFPAPDVFALVPGDRLTIVHERVEGQLLVTAVDTATRRIEVDPVDASVALRREQ
ncbi:MAG: hypothetical protein ACRDGM_19155 [bacterium]